MDIKDGEREMSSLKHLADKGYWIHIIVITMSILLFQTSVSNFILSYIELNEIIVRFFSITFILVIADTILHQILELD